MLILQRQLANMIFNIIPSMIQVCGLGLMEPFTVYLTGRLLQTFFCHWSAGHLWLRGLPEQQVQSTTHEHYESHLSKCVILAFTNPTNRLKPKVNCICSLWHQTFSWPICAFQLLCCVEGITSHSYSWQIQAGCMKKLHILSLSL